MAFVLVDMHECVQLGKIFMSDSIKFTFNKGQKLNTFAYEIKKSNKDKLKNFHFLHVNKFDYSK